MVSANNKVALMIIPVFLVGILIAIFLGAPWVMFIVFVIAIVVMIKMAPSVKNELEKQNSIRSDRMSWEDVRRYYKYPSERDEIINKYAEKQGYTPEQIQAIKESQAYKDAQMSERDQQREQTFSQPEVNRTFEAAPVPPSSHRDESGTVEVTVQSMEPNASFTFNVDDRVVGYIGPQRATLTVPSGMHRVTIVSSDMNRKAIYTENILFNTDKSFTVKKKFGGYTVIKN